MKQAFALLSLSALLFTGACGESANPLLAPQPEAPLFSTSTTPTVTTVNESTVRCSSIGYGSGYLASKYQLSNQGVFSYDYEPAAHDVFKVTRTSTGKFDWSAQKAGIAVSAVIGKQSGGTVFTYATPVSSGSGWSTEGRETSHVELCYQYELQLSATAATSYERTHAWSITKTASESQLTLAEGQAAPVSVGYQIAVSHDQGTDANHAVAGSVTIANPAHFAVDLTGVQAPAGVTVVCPGTFPQPLGAGATLSCSYSAARANADAGSYTFIAQTSTPGVRAGSKTAEFSFGAPKLKDNCVAIEGNMAGQQGTKCVGASSLVVDYSQTFQAASYTCGTHQVVSTASYTTNTSGSTGSASHTLNIDLTCAATRVIGVCTLSQGYWKNHGDPSSKRYDARWANVGGRGASFFGHDKHSWISVWNTAPAGNAYYTLAHQYMAAKLNVLGGAKAPAPVEDAIARAEAFFRANRPGARLSGAARTNAKSWAATLEAFNSRAPYHCSE